MEKLKQNNIQIKISLGSQIDDVGSAELDGLD